MVAVELHSISVSSCADFSNKAVSHLMLLIGLMTLNSVTWVLVHALCLLLLSLGPSLLRELML